MRDRFSGGHGPPRNRVTKLVIGSSWRNLVWRALCRGPAEAYAKEPSELDGVRLVRDVFWRRQEAG